MQKKGALELSMTTIVIIVIGVVLLSLGLTWIRSTFAGIKDLTDLSLATARGDIDKVSHTEEITITPETFKVNKGSHTTIKLYISNLGDATSIFTATVDPPPGIDVNFADTNEKTSLPYTIRIGDEVGIIVYVLAKSDAKLGPIGIPFEIRSSNWDQPKTRSTVVDVQKKSGLI